MPQARRPPEPRQPHDRIAALAQEALDAFRHDLPEQYKELVAAFDDRGADLALLGHGRFHIAVRGGDVSISSKQQRGGLSGRGAATPETIHAILNGESTPLEEFFRGNLIAQAPSEELHRVYDYFVRFADAALRSERMQKVADHFRREFPPEQRYDLE
jgi:hypothetical protein